MAQRYLDAVSGQEVDRGWSFLHPSAQDAWGSQSDFIAAAEAADWSNFEVAAIEAVYSDDGIWCPVALTPGNAELMVVLPDLFRGPGGVTPGGG